MPAASATNQVGTVAATSSATQVAYPAASASATGRSAPALLPNLPLAPAVRATNQYFFKNSLTSGVADFSIYYGNPGDTVLVGDWNGDGRDTLAVRRANQYYVKNSLASGIADHEFTYGNPNDSVLVGDWDGDGVDTLAVRRGNQYFVKNDLKTGVADQVFVYGNPGDTVLVGDWNGDGRDTLAVRRANKYYVKNNLETGIADHEFTYGNPNDSVLVGDWDGDGVDTLAVRRGNQYFVKNDLKTGIAETVFAYGINIDAVYAGDWNGDGRDTLMVRRMEAEPESAGIPVMVYGTLRTGQEADFVVNGTYTSKRVARAPWAELWVTNGNPLRGVWPWAVPGNHGLVGEVLTFGPANYNQMIRKLDRWEGFVPGRSLNRMNYTREIVDTNLGPAYVYVATPWRQAQARAHGVLLPDGDFTRY
ncbi:Gamma-glutamyl cyclotransferase, AIG2-like [Actinobaculum suis]|uniref:Gamma-glutamyl cyclotransferase, AIG2-like n=1 Tax=Actinobaculum suis TaxID=1657 RepID=A0A1G7DNF9_9ACTO|nr:gamma-glutamylcyclotransferase family protein [Actinobaculum suis]MDY5153535.1 gamma-glutamylcyclotransferase family protein [Actinobaculum suis]SDE53033.1 Gamma-glutamyl cyclotransferase, AIG2-like [Actinobaculum suis]